MFNILTPFQNQWKWAEGKPSHGFPAFIYNCKAGHYAGIIHHFPSKTASEIYGLLFSCLNGCIDTVYSWVVKPNRCAFNLFLNDLLYSGDDNLRGGCHSNVPVTMASEHKDILGCTKAMPPTRISNWSKVWDQKVCQ